MLPLTLRLIKQQWDKMTLTALIYFVQQRNMTKYIGSCIVANPLNLKACV